MRIIPIWKCDKAKREKAKREDTYTYRISSLRNNYLIDSYVKN